MSIKPLTAGLGLGCLLLTWTVPIQSAQSATSKELTSINSAAVCASRLSHQVDRLIDQPQFQRSQWGILIQTLEANPQTLYARNADRFFVPASSAKLLTTAAALTELGAQFRFRTSVYAVGTTPEGAVLQVVGRGDPSLTDAQLQALAQQIRDRGITRIATLIGDDRYFQGDAVNPTWEWEDIQAGYGAPVNSLILNQNAIGLTLVPQRLGEPLRVVWDQPSASQGWQIVNRSQTVAADAPEFVTVGRELSQPILTVAGQLRAGAASEPVAVSIPQPGQNFLRQFAETLERSGITVDRTRLLTDAAASAEDLPALNGPEVAAVESPPLSELLVETNQNSNNLYAEALLRSLGARADSSKPALEAGLAALKESLTRLGIDPESYELADGSGLSRRNWVSPTAIVETLQAMARVSSALLYRSSLSIAGISGTLQNRFRETPIQGHLQGKTGALTGVVALAGYLDRGDANQLPQGDDHPSVVFSIVVNQADASFSETRQTIDAVVMLLSEEESCSSFAK